MTGTWAAALACALVVPVLAACAPEGAGFDRPSATEAQEESSPTNGQQELPAPVKDMVAGTNEGDSERFLEAFAQDATLNDWGRVFSGRAGIADWNDNENIGVGARFNVRSAEVRPEDVTLHLEVTGGGYNGPGTFELQLEAGHITSMTIR